MQHLQCLPPLPALHGSTQAELPRLVQLTKELSNSEDALRGLSDQITGYHEATRATTTAVAQRLSAFRSKLEERAALEARLEGLRLLRRLAEALNAVEGLLAAPPPTDAALDCYATGGEGGEGGDGMPRPLLALLAEAETLCRAAESFGQLRLLARRAAEGGTERGGTERGGAEGGGGTERAEAALVRRSGPRIERARTLLVGRLQDCLGVSLEAECAAPVRDCLRAAVETGCVDELYGWLRQEWVRPRLLPQLQQAALGVRETALPAIVAACLAFAHSEAFAPLLQPELATTKPALHVLTQSLWVEVASFLTSSTPQFFGAGIPDAFHQAHTLLSELQARHPAPTPMAMAHIAVLSPPLSEPQAQLEGLLSSAAQRRYLRAHPATADLRRRFNLPIYFQLRVQEVGRMLDAALLPRGTPLAAAAATPPETTPPPAAATGGRALVLPPPPPPSLSTAAALALVEAVRLCFSPAVLLKPLSARFLRLALQTVARFSDWLLSLPPPTAAAEPAPTATPTAATTAAAAAAGTSQSTSQADGGGEGALLYVELHLDAGDCLTWLRSLAPLLPTLIGLDKADAATPPATAAATATAATATPSIAASLGGDCSSALLEAVESLAAADGKLRTALVGRRALM